MTTKFATAIVKEADSRSAGANAARKALAGLGGSKPTLAVVFCSPRYTYGDVLRGVREIAGNIPLVGCSSAGEFNERQVETESVACALLSSDSLKVSTGLGTGLKADELAMISEAKQKLSQPDKDFPHRLALLLVDGLAGKGEEATLAAAAMFGQGTKLAGGCAADDLKFKETFVFCNDAVASNAISIAMLDMKQAPAIGVKHGHMPISKQMKITRAKNNVVYEFDGKPAFDVWKQAVRDRAVKDGLDIDNLTDPSAIGKALITYELGLCIGDEYKVRVPLSKNDDGSLNFACTMMEGSVFKIMQSPCEAQIESARRSAALAMSRMNGRKIAGAIIFDCVCRGIILGKDFPRGVEAIKSVIGDVPLIGFETYGEIAMETGQFSGLHNTTTVTLLIPA